MMMVVVYLFHDRAHSFRLAVPLHRSVRGALLAGGCLLQKRLGKALGILTRRNGVSDVDVEDCPVLLVAVVVVLRGRLMASVMCCGGSTNSSCRVFGFFLLLLNRSVMRLVCSLNGPLLVVIVVVVVVLDDVVVVVFIAGGLSLLSALVVVRCRLLRILLLIDLSRIGVVLGIGDAVAGPSSSAMHHAVVDRDVSWVSCIACRR